SAEWRFEPTQTTSGLVVFLVSRFIAGLRAEWRFEPTQTTSGLVVFLVSRFIAGLRAERRFEPTTIGLIVFLVGFLCAERRFKAASGLIVVSVFFSRFAAERRRRFAAKR